MAWNHIMHLMWVCLSLPGFSCGVFTFEFYSLFFFILSYMCFFHSLFIIFFFFFSQFINYTVCCGTKICMQFLSLIIILNICLMAYISGCTPSFDFHINKIRNNIFKWKHNFSYWFWKSTIISSQLCVLGYSFVPCSFLVVVVYPSSKQHTSLK